MTAENTLLFNRKFLAQFKALMDLHHSLYTRIPPPGPYFESLVEQTFRRSGWPADGILLSTAGAPPHDLRVGEVRLALRTEIGIGTNPELITLARLCMVETSVWDSPTVIQHALDYLARYNGLLMLRAIWGPQRLHYQLLEIPLELLKRMTEVTLLPVGKRVAQPSLAADVFEGEEKMFRVQFDGADGKCQIQRLRVSRCRLLLAWEQLLE